jgi:hypothetical protein
VLLSDYRRSQAFLLDTDSGSVEARGPVSVDEVVEGFGQWRNFGLLKERRRVFVAIFLRRDRFVLWIDGTEYDLLNPDITVQRLDFLPFFARSLRIKNQGRAVLEVKYWFFQREAWPDDGDIFSLAERIVSSDDGGRGLVHVWKARAAGRDLESKEFLAELEELRRS